jgi:hypothetical protein
VVLTPITILSLFECKIKCFKKLFKMSNTHTIHGFANTGVRGGGGEFALPFYQRLYSKDVSKKGGVAVREICRWFGYFLCLSRLAPWRK